MNKITLTIALVFGFTIANAQDTTCTFFAEHIVYKFNYYTSKAIGKEKQTERYYDINVKHGDVLCLDLVDFHKYKKVRKVKITYFDGSTSSKILNSYDNFYYLSNDIVKVSVSKPRRKLK